MMRHLPALLLPLALCAAPAQAAPLPESHVTATLLADVTAVAPSQPFTLAIILTTQPHWHIYWKNPGDAGMPTSFTFHLPAGFHADPAAFPLPTRFAQPGDIVAYGYSGASVFLTRISPPKNLPPGQNIALSVEVSWLCCKDVCVPGGEKLSLTLPTAAAAQPSAENQKLFADARAALPADAPPPDIATITNNPQPDAANLSATIHWKTPPAKGSVDLFPLTPDSLALSGIKIDTHADLTRISLHARILGGGAGQKLTSPSLPVLVTYTSPLGQHLGFYTDLDLHALAAGVK